MGLFDDLLKKPTDTANTSSGQSSGQTDDTTTSAGQSSGQVSDPLAIATPTVKIEKSSEISIVTESPAMTAPNMPAPVVSMASDDISSIIITPASESSDIIVSSEPVSVISTTDNPISSVDISVVEPTIAPVEATTQEVTDLGNLFGDSSISTEEAITAPELETLSEATTEEVSMSLMGDSSVESTPEMISTSSTDVYEHPAEFIAASIARIDAMIARIDTAHNSKLGEALGYKTEKEKYTALEEQAYTDAEQYTEERDHALAMRAYFANQNTPQSVREASVVAETPVESIASVETVMTGLAVQNAVTEAVKPEKKAKAKKEEEEIGILGL